MVEVTERFSTQQKTNTNRATRNHQDHGILRTVVTRGGSKDMTELIEGVSPLLTMHGHHHHHQTIIFNKLFMRQPLGVLWVGIGLSQFMADSQIELKH